MTTTHRRIALLTGASLVTIGLTTPALAAPHDSPTLAQGAHPGINSTADTLTICNIGPATPVGPCFYGFVDTTGAAATALVNTTANGQITQHQSATTTVDLLMTNNGSAEVGAIAIATNTTGAAAANARNNSAIGQYGSGSDVSLTLHNNGPLLVDALASASATGGHAGAVAYVSYGVSQSASGASNAAVTLNNDNALTVEAVANAVANGGTALDTADATATLYYGIYQHAYASSGDATVNLNNNGTITLAASANAAGYAADASASVTYYGIYQSATAYGTGNAASAAIDNQGALNIIAAAHATATGQSGDATAFAENYDAIYQSANGLSGADANASITNDDTIKIQALAVAKAQNGGVASATVYNDYGIYQSAYATGGGDASATISGEGTIDISATAVANAAAVVTGVGATATTLPGGFASAYASAYNAVQQSAYVTGGGDAHALISQAAINVVANATATGAAASASADNEYAIEQYAEAYGGGDADAVMTLGGGNISAVANAVATSGAASASAEVSSAISQTAYANEGGDASASMTNTGNLSINAIANAKATGFAEASAENTDAIFQTAEAAGQALVGTGPTAKVVGGNASATLTNSGAIAIGASAAANGSLASAEAYVTDAIYQSAFAHGTGTAPVGGNATALIANDGTIKVSAVADANATNATGFKSGTGATATAHASSAVQQYATAGNSYAGTAGDATASLTGTGSIDVGAIAHALDTDGPAIANALVNGAVTQIAHSFGGNASAVISQGSIAAHATALAGGSTAMASASVPYGVYQVAWATDGAAAASMTLGGGNFVASASANATDGSASAIANVGSGTGGTGAISQHAYAGGGNDATVNFSNTGALSIAANAHAVADELAVANASANGIYQSASAYGQALVGTPPAAVVVGGDASISLTNAGTLTVAANATATGFTANAFANVGFGVRQFAKAQGTGTSPVGGDVNISLTNDGTIMIAASAAANPTAADGAALAHVGTGVSQSALALHGGNGSVDLTNAGSLTVAAAASAAGGTRVVGVGATATTVIGDGLAAAQVGTGVYQHARGLNATVSLSNAAAGVIDITASANGSGGNVVGTTSAFTSGTGTTAATYASPFPGAAAIVSQGIHQSATANWGFTQVGAGATAHTVAVGGTAAASLTNAGSIDIAANATASGTGQVMAVAGVSAGISQVANGNGGDASAMLTNSGTITIAATANAVGGTAGGTAVNTADAADTIAVPGAIAVIGTGIHQVANANAVLTGGTAPDGTGIANLGIVGNALASLTNSGSIAVNASANATGTGLANASAAVGAGIHQEVVAGSAQQVVGTGAAAKLVTVGGNATAVLANSGAVNVGAVANASGTSAIANAVASNALWQDVSAVAGVASASMTNSGTVALSASANANGAGVASAVASANAAMLQVANGATATAFMSNAGTVTATANAVAVAAGTVVGVGATATTVGSAVASAHAAGLGQTVTGTAGSATMVNSGTLNVGAHATASGFTAANASAVATGAYQNTGGLPINFTNSGTINVKASAIAAGVATGTGTDAAITTPTGAAFASAVGYSGMGAGGATLAASVVNSGTLNVNATAVAPATAVASAVGIRLENAPTTVTATPVGGTGPVTTVTGNPMVASITNSGTLNVVASASGGATTAKVITGTGTAAVTTTVVTPLSEAHATGILVSGGALGTTTTTTPTGGTAVVHHNNSTITNTGAINVDAITANGGDATAYGIRVVANGDVTPALGNVLTINNSGDITARISMDGGATFHRGEAIDVSEAPNPTVINLLGGGNIYGNIELQSDADVINVTGGETTFNGIVNSACMPADGIAAATTGGAADAPALSSCGVGTLNINNGGNLHLLIDPVDGPSYVFMNTLDMRPTAATGSTAGTITFELPDATGGEAAAGTYPQVFVDTAYLDGTLVADIQSANGLYESTVYQNVIDANVRNGQFDQCVADGVAADSLLLSFGCVYDGQNNVDLALTRAAFNSVSGLNGNGMAVGSGLECIYDVGLTGGTAAMFADLFRITDAANYNIALNQLSGSSYANYLNSFPSLGVHYNDLVDHATNCEVPALAGSVLECRSGAPIHVWGQLDYQWRSADGDFEAGDSKSKRFSGLVGVDTQLGNAAILGIEGGYVTNHLRDRQFGDSMRGEGWQLGAYAVYDPGPFFLKGVTTYSSMNGDSTRRINFAGLGTGTTFTGTLNGSPDVNMWTAGLHAGARLPMGGASVVTPYLNLDYVHAKMKGFTETGATGPALTLFDATVKRTFLTAGAKWATQIGGVVPEVNLGYRYRFGHSNAGFTGQFFDGSSATDCDFDIVSAAQKRGTFLAGLSVGGKVGPVDLRIGYEGEFNGDITSHSGNFKVVLPLGGHAAPPPPPPVVAPPPPPPPVVEQPAPPPPPPPPAPVERGERGQ